MTFTFPSWYLKTHASELDQILEYRLSMADVGELLHAPASSVYHWSRLSPQQQYLPLRFLKVGAHRAYRLHDVREFAKAKSLRLDLRNLPPVLAAAWGIDMQDMEDVVSMNTNQEGVTP